MMMAYIFNAMTHLAVDVTLMAFTFFNLVKNQFYLKDKGKLKNALARLVSCLTLLPCNTRKVVSSFEENLARKRVLHVFEPDLPKDPERF
ncbi:hypothetical protein PVL29_000426 [Vitis rotundifolia]|uniref:Uncharacterized protein n=1 Tax=Vitis rotundifolia TaxID=103349 RepID=A0AA39AL48_VITRO|nr:hypothetical protein PVL29_000426 [Vitis rotundifolia]